MPSLETVTPTKGLFCMFKGEPGTRKSTQALSFPKPQYWFSWDRKMNALLIPQKEWGIDSSLIEYDNYDDWNKGRAKMEKLQVKCKYKTIIVDSFTSLADTILRQVIKGKIGKKRVSGADAGKIISGIPVNEVEDFNAEAAALTETMAILKDIQAYHKINIILIAHVIQADYKNLEGATHVSRTIVTAAKKIAAKIPAYCDEVYHFNVKGGSMRKETVYGLLTQHTGDDFARTVLPLDKEIEFGNNPIYETYLKPAIAQLKPTESMKPVEPLSQL